MPAETATPLYKADVAAWAESQAAALARHDASGLDWDNLAEEIASLGISDNHAIWSHMTDLPTQPMKYELAAGTAIEFLDGLDACREAEDKRPIAVSPSLRRYPFEIFDEALSDAYDLALDELGMRGQRPALTRWTVEQALDEDFCPNKAQTNRPSGGLN